MRLRTRRGRDVEALERSFDTSATEPRNSAVPLVDEALVRFVNRRLVSGTEVVDVLLDLRSALVFDDSFAALLDERKAR
jgi:hypothetical protein